MEEEEEEEEEGALAAVARDRVPVATGAVAVGGGADEPPHHLHLRHVAMHARHYLVPEYLRGFARWHVMVRFRKPVPGPLAIGAGRHVGLGLFAASEE